jgi:RNA polymerase sigma factor (sigma-70 family)
VDAQRRGRAEDRARRREPGQVLDAIDPLVRQLQPGNRQAPSKWERALSELPGTQRDAVRARVLLDRTYAEIAAEEHTTEGNVRQRVARGLARLRQRMQEELR